MSGVILMALAVLCMKSWTHRLIGCGMVYIIGKVSFPIAVLVLGAPFGIDGWDFRSTAAFHFGILFAEFLWLMVWHTSDTIARWVWSDEKKVPARRTGNSSANTGV